MEKKMYKIGLIGCDDSTYIDIELSDAEFELMKRISALSEQESSYQCMPTMSVRLINPKTP